MAMIIFALYTYMCILYISIYFIVFNRPFAEKRDREKARQRES